MTISETKWLIETKFYLKHHWGGGKGALGCGLDQIGTLVCMQRIACIGLQWENVVNTLAPSFLINSSSYFQVTRIYNFSNEFEIELNSPKDSGVSCP